MEGERADGTITGQRARARDASFRRVGGTFTIVDRRDEEDVVHTGKSGDESFTPHGEALIRKDRTAPQT